MKRLLILDDREAYLHALSRALRSDFDIAKARTVEEAQRAASGALDVALLDVRLSDEDPKNREGLTFLEWLKKRHPRVPAVMMSAYQDFDAAVTALNLGADYFLRKPIDLRYLKTVLHDFAEHGRLPEKTAALLERLSEGE